MQNPNHQQDPDQDHRNNGSNGDSTSMTIEFLRARLLAERSVSKTARQRADELAKRVVELEEQLKIVTIQRKKAEKATADVLAILENHEVSDFSEEFDSCSDHCELNVGNSFPEEECSVVSKMERNPIDEFSSSELETCSLPGRSLSWKSGKDSPSSREKKYIVSSPRRRSPFISTSSASPRCRAGTSCRKIRRRETRSMGEDPQINSTRAPQENGSATRSEGYPTSSGIGPESLGRSSENRDSKIFVEGSGNLEGQQLETTPNNYLEVHESDRDMERALEHQAQLIGQYEEEEKAQREWEAKFRENNNSPDSCEPGDHSDITEERDETKADFPPYSVHGVNSADEKAKSNVGNVSITKESSRSEPDGIQSQPPPEANGESSTMLDSLSKGDGPVSKTENYELMPREIPDKLGSVLEALQQAKLSLNHKLNTFPPVDGASARKAIKFSAEDKPEVPVGCAGLFRVPSDFHSVATTKNDIQGLNSKLRLTNYYPGEAMVAPNSTDRFVTSPYNGERRLSVRSDSYMESIPSTSERRLAVPSGPYVESLPSIGERRLAVPSGPYVESLPSIGERRLAVPSGPYMESIRQTGERSLAVPSVPYMESMSSTGERRLAVPSGPYMESIPSTGERSLGVTSGPYMESRSKVSTWGSSFGSSLDKSFPYSSNYSLNDLTMNRGPASSSDIGLSYSNQYVHNGQNADRRNLVSSSSYAAPTYPLYLDPLLRMPSGGEPRLFTSTGTGIAPSNLSFYEDHMRPRMYR